MSDQRLQESDAPDVYEAQCTGCYAKFENYAGGSTYCLRCTRRELERVREQGIKDEVAALVQVAYDVVLRAANQAALCDSAQEKKLDAIVELLRHV